MLPLRQSQVYRYMLLKNINRVSKSLTKSLRKISEGSLTPNDECDWTLRESVFVTVLRGILSRDCTHHLSRYSFILYISFMSTLFVAQIHVNSYMRFDMYRSGVFSLKHEFIIFLVLFTSTSCTIEGWFLFVNGKFPLPGRDMVGTCCYNRFFWLFAAFRMFINKLNWTAILTFFLSFAVPYSSSFTEQIFPAPSNSV